MTTLKQKIATLTAQGMPETVAVHQAEMLHAYQQYKKIMELSCIKSKACYWRKKERECQAQGITLEQYKEQALKKRGRKPKTAPLPDVVISTE